MNTAVISALLHRTSMHACLLAMVIFSPISGCKPVNSGNEAAIIHKKSETQQLNESEYQIQVAHSCNFIDELTDQVVLAFSSDLEAENALNRIMKLTGLSSNFEIKSSSVPNASAVIKVADNGDVIRYILYNQEFLEQLKTETNTNFAELAVLAHEIGHHLNGHTLNSTGNRHDNELEADRFAGFILYKLNASIEEAKEAYSGLPDEESSTHPAKPARLAALSSGWYDAKRNGESQVNNTSMLKEVGSSPQSSSSQTTLKTIARMESYMNANISSVVGKARLSFDSRARILSINDYRIPLDRVMISYQNKLELGVVTLSLDCHGENNCIYNVEERKYCSGYGIILDHESQYEKLDHWLRTLK